MLVVVLVFTLGGCGPGEAEQAREQRFGRALERCDQEPDLGVRFDCWAAAYAQRREEGG